MPEIKCKKCGRKPEEIMEYIDSASEEGTTPTEYVKLEEGTYNDATGLFYCTACYISVGMPLGTA